MMKKALIVILILSMNYAQDTKSVLLGTDNYIDTNSMQLKQDIDLTDFENLTYTPVEEAINPSMYILGPGDLLGINIIAAENIFLPVRVNPVGELMIPSVGVIDVNGVSLNDAKFIISDYIVKNVLQNSHVSVTLLDIRRFKIQVLGAVSNPGFIYVTSVDKVYEAVLKSGGVQKFAHPDIIKIIRENETIEVQLKNYFSGEDPSQNKTLKLGDIIFVPFNDYAKSLGFDSLNYNDHHVIVHGFVNRSGTSNTYKYYPGYTARDYIAMTGGTKVQGSSFRSGNINKTRVFRSDGSTIKNALDEVIQPGDIIEVPPSLLYQFVGQDGMARTLASIISSAYIIYKFSQE
jgi:protein involved in polysaccharide export with SLBB domain